MLPVQVPYRHIARKICKGKVLDIGCGAGRYLSFLRPNATGIDHNFQMVEFVRKKGFKAYLPDEFFSSEVSETKYKTLLFSHIFEHMLLSDGQRLLQEYLPYLQTNGTIVIIVPQGLAYNSDYTHICPYDDRKIEKLIRGTGIRLASSFTFPFPAIIGKILPYNDAIYILKTVKVSCNNR